MVVEVVLEIVGYVAGVASGIGVMLLGKRARQRCSARLYSENHHIQVCKEGDWEAAVSQGPRYKEFVDPRCVSGYCILHCRGEKRCRGECVK